MLPFLLDAGVTRVEIGVECLHDDVLAEVGRAHTAEDVVRATREARDRGLKVGYHLMLGLPGMDPSRDLSDFGRLWSHDEFRPDFLKIYPTLVLPGTPLFDEWRAGRYSPYDEETATGVLVAMKRVLPSWVRIQRIQRDIPSRLIAAGVRASNIRQLALARLAVAGQRCRCLRCREVGRRATPPFEELADRREEYTASGGREVFLSIEHPASEAIAAFLRLRFPSSETDGGLEEPIVRELKVVGSPVAVGHRAGRPTDFQHRGLGAALLARAEAETSESGYGGLYVTSAVGTREYYQRQGFVRAGPLMRKALGSSKSAPPILPLS